VSCPAGWHLAGLLVIPRRRRSCRIYNPNTIITNTINNNNLEVDIIITLITMNDE